MLMWFFIMIFSLSLFVLSFFYLSNRFMKIFIFKFMILATKLKILSILSVGIIFFVISYFLNFVNSIICFIYLTMIWIICDIVFFICKKFLNFTCEYYVVGVIAIILTIIILLVGWYLNHNVFITEYNLTTDKNINNLKIAFFADSHIGTTFDYKGFEKHIKTIKNLNPDILFIVGDYVDDDTKKIDMLKCSEFLGNLDLKYGIHFVLGNHDKGYYSSKRRGFDENDLINELEKNKVNVLRDESILIDNSFYVIGRKDYSTEKERKGKRKTIKDLTDNLDKNKYMIVLDHQPVDYKNEEENVDLVLSGHTHGGQIFPFNNVGKWIKANDLVYGLEKRGKTNFLVTSGISCWSIKFKTGTKSELVIVNIKKK